MVTALRAHCTPAVTHALRGLSYYPSHRLASCARACARRDVSCGLVPRSARSAHVGDIPAKLAPLSLPTSQVPQLLNLIYSHIFLRLRWLRMPWPRGFCVCVPRPRSPRPPCTALPVPQFSLIYRALLIILYFPLILIARVRPRLCAGTALACLPRGRHGASIRGLLSAAHRPPVSTDFEAHARFITITYTSFLLLSIRGRLGFMLAPHRPRCFAAACGRPFRPRAESRTPPTRVQRLCHIERITPATYWTLFHK